MIFIWFRRIADYFRSDDMKTHHHQPPDHDHGLSDSRRMVIAMERVARSLDILVDRRISALTERLNKSSDALARAVKKSTPKH